jgi:hypothetical protein
MKEAKAVWMAKQNRRRFAMRQVTSFLKQRGVQTYRVKRNALICTFARMAGLTVQGGPTDWLIDLWSRRANEHVSKAEGGFYQTTEWIVLRQRVLDHYGSVCMKCGGTDTPSVDHIKPRSLFPALELEFDNMQVLCKPCNSGKSNRHETDYRANTVRLRFAQTSTKKQSLNTEDRAKGEL